MKVVKISQKRQGKKHFDKRIEQTYPVPDGMVELYGQDINTISKGDVSRLITAIEQELVFLTGMLLENMRMVAPSATEEEVAIIASGLGSPILRCA